MDDIIPRQALLRVRRLTAAVAIWLIVVQTLLFLFGDGAPTPYASAERGPTLSAIGGICRIAPTEAHDRRTSTHSGSTAHCAWCIVGRRLATFDDVSLAASFTGVYYSRKTRHPLQHQQSADAIQ
jgi:hypothetical protein